VVVGEPLECAAAARQLGEAGWKVITVTSQRCRRCGVGGGCRRRVGADVVCATGIEYLEALVLRRIGTGRIEALHASALFVCFKTRPETRRGPADVLVITSAAQPTEN